MAKAKSEDAKYLNHFIASESVTNKNKSKAIDGLSEIAKVVSEAFGGRSDAISEVYKNVKIKNKGVICMSHVINDKEFIIDFESFVIKDVSESIK